MKLRVSPEALRMDAYFVVVFVAKRLPLKLSSVVWTCKEGHLGPTQTTTDQRFLSNTIRYLFEPILKCPIYKFRIVLLANPSYCLGHRPRTGTRAKCRLFVMSKTCSCQLDVREPKPTMEFAMLADHLEKHVNIQNPKEHCKSYEDENTN